MADIKNVGGIDAPPAGITLLADLDFTTMTSASWRGEDTVSLNGQTWKIGNGANSNQFGPNGSTLIFHPKGTNAGDWWGSARTGPYLSIKLASLDADLDATAQYVIQTVCDEFPAGVDTYARFLTGFWSDDGTSRGYTNLFGVQDNGSEVLYYYLGGTEQGAENSDEDELTYYTYLNPTGFNEVRTSTSEDGNTPRGGTAKGAMYAAAAAPETTGDQRTLLLTASAPVNVGIVGVGRTSATTGPVYKVNRVRVWKLHPSI